MAASSSLNNWEPLVRLSIFRDILRPPEPPGGSSGGSSGAASSSEESMPCLARAAEAANFTVNIW